MVIVQLSTTPHYHFTYITNSSGFDSFIFGLRDNCIFDGRFLLQKQLMIMLKSKKNKQNSYRNFYISIAMTDKFAESFTIKSSD